MNEIEDIETTFRKIRESLEQSNLVLQSAIKKARKRQEDNLKEWIKKSK